MAYGIAVRTQFGLTALGTLRTAQEIGRYTASVVEGQVNTPTAVNPSNGGVLVNVLDGKEAPQVRMRGDGKTLWENFATPSLQSSSFEIIWIRFA